MFWLGKDRLIKVESRLPSFRIRKSPFSFSNPIYRVLLVLVLSPSDSPTWNSVFLHPNFFTLFYTKWPSLKRDPTHITERSLLMVSPLVDPSNLAWLIPFTSLVLIILSRVNFGPVLCDVPDVTYDLNGLDQVSWPYMIQAKRQVRWLLLSISWLITICLLYN